jgi:hypothetical protein
MLCCIRTSFLIGVLWANATLATPLKLDYDTQGKATLGRLSINYGLHQHDDPYVVNGDNWDVWLDPDPPTYLRAATENAANVISSEFKPADGWTYQSAARELSDDSLVVRVYAARSGGGNVGAEFLAEYIPHAGDPLDVHWIQNVQSNHP